MYSTVVLNINKLASWECTKHLSLGIWVECTATPECQDKWMGRGTREGSGQKSQIKAKMKREGKYAKIIILANCMVQFQEKKKKRTKRTTCEAITQIQCFLWSQFCLLCPKWESILGEPFFWGYGKMNQHSQQRKYGLLLFHIFLRLYFATETQKCLYFYT